MAVGASLDADVRFLVTRLGWGGVAVVGAGLSLAARYPLTSLLPPLVWKGVDADPESREKLAAAVGANADLPAKQLVGHDPAMLNRAWEIIDTSDTARAAFQNGFAALDRERAAAPTPAFDALARLLHARIVEQIVSFNWDTGVERAYRRRYGTNIPPGLLSKPHGDAAHPDLPWVLPHEDGRLDDALMARLATIRGGHPRTLLVVGYSESDTYVVDELIVPLSREWETVRIGPSATGPLGIARGAQEVLPPVADELCAVESSSPWQYLTFGEQRDGLAAALLGARLGPGDVTACPRLPEVDQVVAALRAAAAVGLRGASGGGKSITAYQALCDLNDSGYEIVRARERLSELPTHDVVGALLAAPWPTVAFVDDAQALDPDLLRRLAETATTDHKVLIASTDPLPGPAIEVTVAEQRAVQTLANALLERRADVLARVRDLDNTVGDGYSDQPLEQRIEIAAMQKLPWQFVFVLTGGWRRAQHTIAGLRDDERADLAFLAVAVCQIASADAGAHPTDVERLAAIIGRDAHWMGDALDRLRRDRHITGDRRLRVAHLQMAMATVRIQLHPPVWPVQELDRPTVPPILASSVPAAPAQTPPASPSRSARHSGTAVPHPDEASDRSAVAALLADALSNPATPLLGVLWLLDTVRSAEVHWALMQTGIPGPDLLARLATRSLASTDPAQRATAGRLLTELLHWDKETTAAALVAAEDILVDWVRAVDPVTAGGIAPLFNSLGRSHPDLTLRILARCDPTTLARSVSNTRWADASAWAEAVSRLAYAGDTTYAHALAESLDPVALHELYTDVPRNQLWAVNDLTETIYFLRPELGTALAATAASQLAAHLSAQPVTATAALHTLFWWPLGYAPGFLRHGAPTAAQRRASRALARAIDPSRVAAAISGGSRRDWQTLSDLLGFFAEADPTMFHHVSAAVDLDELDRHATGLWSVLPRELLQMLWLLAHSQHKDDVINLVTRHAGEISHLTTPLVTIAPAVAVAVMRRGIPLDIGFTSHDWDSAAEAVLALQGEDPGVAALVLAANRDTLRHGLDLCGHGATDGLDRVLGIIDTLVPNFVDDVLATLDPHTVTGWQEHLRRRNRMRQVVCNLVVRTATGSGPAADAAAALLRRFPSIAHSPTGPQRGPLRRSTNRWG